MAKPTLDGQRGRKAGASGGNRKLANEIGTVPRDRREVPASDHRLIQAVQRTQGDGGKSWYETGSTVPGRIARPRETRGTATPLYPYTKGVTLVNDGVAYGEYLHCELASIKREGGRVILNIEDSRSLRTRSGRVGTVTTKEGKSQRKRRGGVGTGGER